MKSGGFDIVLGNPPYIDSETMTHRLCQACASYCNARYRTATGNWDLFCIFIEKGLDLCKSGGLVSMIVPNKLASAHYATQTRALLAGENQLQAITDYSKCRRFLCCRLPPGVCRRENALLIAIATVRYPTGSLTLHPPLYPTRNALAALSESRRASN